MSLERLAPRLRPHAATIFDEAENRLHVQKAIVAWLAS